MYINVFAIDNEKNFRRASLSDNNRKAPLPGFEPGPQPPQGYVLSRLDYRGIDGRIYGRFLKVSFKEKHYPRHCRSSGFGAKVHELGSQSLIALSNVVPVVVRNGARIPQVLDTHTAIRMHPLEQRHLPAHDAVALLFDSTEESCKR